MKREEFLKKVLNSGIVGQGGAGFPTHVKYASKAEIIIVNACECEPLLAVDVYLAEKEAQAVLLALAEVLKQTGAKRGIVAIKGKHKAAVEALSRANENSRIEIFQADNFYPAGDEQVLVREATGRTVPPMGLPGQVGVLVTNIATLFSVYEALQGIPCTQKLVTVTGDVKNPGIIRVPLGMSVDECIRFCGGACTPDYSIILGGPMMGRLSEPGSGAVITKTMGGIIVLPKDHSVAASARLSLHTIQRRAASACIQCRLCTDICPRHLLGHPLEPHRIMRAFAAGCEENPVFLQSLLCSECGACEKIACPMGLAPRRVNAFLKQKLRQSGNREKPGLDIREGQDIWREYRKIPTERLVERLNLGRFKHSHPYLGEAEPLEVRIPLSQHIGAPAKACCQTGDMVSVGDVIAEPQPDALSTYIHASIQGTVIAVDDAVVIRRA